LRRTFDVVSIGSYVLTAIVAVIVLLALHHNFFTAFVVGMAWGAVPQGLAWGLAELVAPGWVIRWRQKLIGGAGDVRKPVGDYFSRLFATTGPEPWTSAEARKRVRTLGVGLTVFWVVCLWLLVWLPPHLDSLLVLAPQT